MRNLILTALFLIPGLASAEWKLNPYTQRMDYYESKAAVVLSTGAIQAQVDALHVTTTTLTQDLATEVSRATVRENAIGASTGTLKTQIDAVAVSTGAINADLQAYKTTVQVSTASIYSALNSTASALTAEVARAISRENNIGASTGAIKSSLDAVVLSTGSIRASLDAVILSTAPLKDYANWNTAYGWGDHAGLYLTEPATFYIVRPTEYLQAPATFYVVKTSDYLVAPASFTYQTPLVAGTDYLAPNGDGSGLSGVIQSTATGNYLFRVATATYLATAPGNCSAGEFISGLTADGTKTCATPAGGGDVVAAGTNTFTGSNTFASSVTFAGAVIGAVKSTATTNMAATSYAATSLGNVCVTGSTLTFIADGKNVTFTASGVFSASGANQAYSISVVVDGAVISPGATGGTTHYVATVGNPFGFSFLYPLSAGSHWACLTMAVQSGTTSLPNESFSPATKARFSVRY